MGLGSNLELALIVPDQTLGRAACLARSAFILKGSPFANVFWLAFWEHLCPVVSYCLLTSCGAKLGITVVLETNAVLTVHLLETHPWTADPFSQIASY